MTRIEKGSIAPKLSRLDSIARNLQCSVPALFRHYSEDESDRSKIIIDALAGLPEEAQDAVVNLVLQVCRIVNGQSEK